MRSLQRDTSGAIMVVAVFMAMIAVGALYYMSGLGDAILAQERMQDAADASAFSSAVIHARGMNVLALINIMMASLLAILVLLSMLSSLFTAAVVILGAISWIVPAAAPLIPLANSASKGFSQAEKSAKGPVHNTVKAMHKLQGPLNRAIPMLASVNAAKLSRNNYGKVVEFGVTFPIMDGLPTKEGDFKRLCEKAGNYAGKMAVAPIKAAVGDNFLTDMLADGAESVGEKYASFYCGDGPKPKAKIFKEKVSIPELNTPEGASCKEDHDDANCERYEEQLKRVKDAYDEQTGTCKQPGSDAEVKKLCNEIRMEARTQCNPKTSDPNILASTWEERRYTRRWVLQGQGDSERVVEVSENPIAYDYSLRGDNPKVVPPLSPGISAPGQFGAASLYLRGKVPCGSEFHYRGAPMSKWSKSAGDNEPICASKVEVPTLALLRALDVREYEIEVLEVVDVLRCTIKKAIESKLNGEPMSPEDKQGMAPQEMCSCSALGEESFQVRSIVLGSPDKYTESADRSILVATQGKKAAASQFDALGKYAGRLAAAQAEYYYNDAGANRAEWLWNMKWKARMRRLAFKREAFQCKVKDDCNIGQGRLLQTETSEQAGAINSFKDLIGNADNIIVH